MIWFLTKLINLINSLEHCDTIRMSSYAHLTYILSILPGALFMNWYGLWLSLDGIPATGVAKIHCPSRRPETPWHETKFFQLVFLFRTTSNRHFSYSALFWISAQESSRDCWILNASIRMALPMWRFRLLPGLLLLRLQRLESSQKFSRWCARGVKIEWKFEKMVERCCWPRTAKFWWPASQKRAWFLSQQVSSASLVQ